jgi:hypothetical protein
MSALGLGRAITLCGGLRVAIRAAHRHVNDPGFLLVERHTKRFENPSCSRQGVFRLRSSPTGHNPVIRPACEPVPD